MEGSSGGEASLATRRLCAAVSGAGPGSLTSALRPGAFGRLYIAGTVEGEVAVASAGIDEFQLVRDLAVALDRHLAGTPDHSTPVFLAVGVGIVRIVNDGFDGAELRRIRSLAQHPAVRRIAVDIAPRGARLVVAISAGLYGDLMAEGLVGAEWRHVPEADAWLRWIGPGWADEEETERGS